MALPDYANEFRGKRALVTGGSRGIGAAIARRLIEGGAKVIVSARETHPETPTEAIFVKADLRSNDGAKTLAVEALRLLGGLDILVNNAGAARGYLPGAEAIPDEEWVDAIDINLLSAVRLTTALLPALKQSKGAIVNLSSGGATPLPSPLAHYGASKAALAAYSRSLAQELGPQGVRVNLVTPGPVITPGGDLVRKTFSDAMGVPPDSMAATVPMRRLGEAHEVAEMVALLVSERGSWMTSGNYFVDGGAGSA